jgi:hypothetical protein
VLRRSVRQVDREANDPPATHLQSDPVRRILVLACISACAGGPAHGQAIRDASSEIAQCTGIADPSERLKCFDTAAQRATGGFGLARPAKPVTKAEDFGKPPPRPAEITQIKASVLEFAKTARGRALFVLDNDQTWRQLDADSTEVRDPPPGKAMRVTIETGVLDSYNLTIEGRNGLIKVRRVK